MHKKLKIFLLGCLAFGCLPLLSGCKESLSPLLHPKGTIGRNELELIYVALMLMLIIVVPVIIMVFTFAWKYRASNPNAKYDPGWHHSNKIEAVVWGIPIIIIIILATITWKTTHELDPFKPIEIQGVEPMTIQVVALDWKWLFIYPNQKIATVNFVEFPANTPIEFKITADAPMNAFMIPQLGGQIYAMAGMQTKLHLIADEPGDYDGRSVSFSGAGFNGMTFIARATQTHDEFNAWVDNVKQQNPAVLDSTIYNELAKPSQYNVPQYFGSVEDDLFGNIIMKFMMPDMKDEMHMQGMGS